MDFYERVKNLIKENNYSLQAFLESLSINYHTYKSQKNAGNLPRADEAVKIAQALNTTVEYLVMGIDTNNSQIQDLKQKLKSYIDTL